MFTWFPALLLASCTNSGLGLVQTADTGPLTVGCPWEGDWELVVVECSSFPYNEKWDSVYDNVTMSIEADGDNGCAVDFSWSAATCSETESWRIDPVIPDFTEDEDPDEWSFDGKAEVTYGGIDSCDPAGCDFDQGDMSFSSDTCSEGDRDGLSADIEIDDSKDDQLTIEGLLDDPGRHDCVLGLKTTWTRK